MKIVMLMPCLMLENNRKANNKALDYALEHYDVDLIAINAQEFEDYDYRDNEKIKYIHRHDVRQGFVKGRNQLLEWFYNSDYDWAVWLDANAKVSGTTLNDFRTIVNAIKNNEIDSKVDVILSTLGIWISSFRIDAKKLDGHKEYVNLVDVPGNDNLWMHGMFMRNFASYHNVKPFIDTRCDPHKGITEDVYFVKLCKKLFNVKLCPTIVITKPSSKSSTWAAGKDGKYDYPELGHSQVYRMVASYDIIERVRVEKFLPTYKLARVEYARDKVTVYKARNKKKLRGGLL